jgi:hypothetical protein
MSEAERNEIRYMINRIIDLLQKSAASVSDMGSRYSRLLQLLWNRAPRKSLQPREKVHPQSIDSLLIPAPNQPSTILNNQVYDQNSYNGLNHANGTDGNSATGNTFSWLDLGAAWTFATQNNTNNGSTGDMGEMMGESGSGWSPYDANMNLLSDYRLLNDDNTTLIF